MVSRHLTVPYEFVCLTDDPTPIDNVRLIVQRNAGYIRPWWHKVHMFDPTLELHDRILYFDLDILIHANIDKLILNRTDEFLGIRDFNRKFHPTWNILNSSAMSWDQGKHSDIWRLFHKDLSSAQKLHGDQDWIWKIAKDRIKFWPDEWLMSYKWELRERNELTRINGTFQFKNVRNPRIPKECSVVVFHGDPKPQDIEDPFVIDNWK
jgi:hypothetical protein